MKALLITPLLLATTLKLLAANLYVSPTGSNANAGSIGQPYRTIQFALTVCNPGDSILVRGGTYFEKLIWQKSGTANHNLCLKNFGQETVIVDGTGSAGVDLLKIEGHSYLHIEGITFQNNYQQEAKGVFIRGEGTNIVLNNCVVKNIGWTTDPDAAPFSVDPNGQAHGILVNGRTTQGIRNIKVLNTIIQDIITGNSEALTIAGNVDGFEITNCTVFNTKNIGIVAAGHYPWAINSGVSAILNQARNGFISNCIVYNNRRFSDQYAPAGIYIDGAKNILLIGNKSYRNGNGISIGCENPESETSGILMINNVVYNNDKHGLVLGSNQATSLVRNASILNNTLFKNGSSAIYHSEITLQNSASCTIINNILIPRSDSHYALSIFGYTTTVLTVDYNLAYRYSGTTTFLYVPGTPAQFTPTNTLTANPALVDTLTINPNFVPAKTSSAINAGSPTYTIGAELDASAQFRIVNGRVDMGAFERQDGGCPTMHTINSTQVLKGKFVASQSIELSPSASNAVENVILLSSPVIKIVGTTALKASMKVDGIGCF